VEATKAPLELPPTASTFPPGSVIIPKLTRGMFMLAAPVQLLVAGS